MNIYVYMRMTGELLHCALGNIILDVVDVELAKRRANKLDSNAVVKILPVVITASH